MPTLNNGGKSPGHSNGHIGGQTGATKAHHRPDLARDDLKGAFAGNENENNKKSESHSTNVKSRKTEHSKEKTPKI